MKRLILIFLLPLIAIAAETKPKFSEISKPNQKRVKAAYQEVIKAFEKQDYEKVKANTAKILALVEDYQDTASYKAIADEKLAGKAKPEGN